MIFSDSYKRRSLLALILASLFIFDNAGALKTVFAQKKRRPTRDSSGTSLPLTDERRTMLVLTRLGFGARPGDFERVKAMGIEAYINGQLDFDSIDDAALDRRLSKLPTLALATPALIEQYNPPKPAPVPSPAQTSKPTTTAPAPTVNATPASSAKESIKPLTNPLNNAGTTQTAEMKKPIDSPPTKPMPPKPPPPHNPQQAVTELQRAALLRAVYSERQLYELTVDFWENHFSIYAQKDADRLLMTGFDREAIRPFAFGRFRDLLGATAHSPAMLFYLDNWQSSVVRKYPASNGKPARVVGGINENYARELMELHTLGVDGGYTQTDVQEVARCFTGWSIAKPNVEGLFVFNPAAHDNGEKIVLGKRIPAGGGIADGERVLDILAHHPSTARFISTKLARRLWSDDPPPSVINRAAEVFLKTDGSIRETLRAIITSPDFFSSANYRAKTRSPFEYAAAALRALKAETDGDRSLLDSIARMGQPIFGRITPDGYPDRAEQWLSTGALLERFNFAGALATNKIKGTHVDLIALFKGDANDSPQDILARVSHIALGGDLPIKTRAALENVIAEETPGASGINQINEDSKPPAPAVLQITASSPTVQAAKSQSGAALPAHASKVIILLLGSPEFQRR